MRRVVACGVGYLALAGVAAVLFIAGCAVNRPVNLDSPSQAGPASSPVKALQPDSPIADIQANGVTSSSVNITWTTVKPSSALIQWGKTTDYEFTTRAEGEYSLQQAVRLTGLRPATVYHYRITATDESGGQVTGPDLTFSTLEQLNTRPLAISRIGMVKITGTGATIAWATDSPATGQVEYGKTMAYGTSTTVNTSSVYNHYFDLHLLSPGTVYHFRLRSIDKNGNEAVSEDQTFTTVDPSDFTAPVVSDVVISNVTHMSATISWVTSDLATCQVEYDRNVSYLNITPPETVLSLTHTVTIGNLTNGKAYYYRIKSTDPAGNVSTSPEMLFVTAEAPRVLGTMTYDYVPCKCSSPK
jgi:phosphodiesterase/alkaline phosphatase D-like protein